MKQTNNYDDYAPKLAQLLRSGAQKSHAFIEKPAMLKLLPDLKNKSVLCAGCGTGEECGELLRRGAIVDGFDISKLRRVLKEGGHIQFSVVHPIKWAGEVKRDPQDENKKGFLMGYDTYQTPAHIYGDYLNITKVTQKPQNYPEITYWNRPISSYLRIIREEGFNLIDFVEPKAIPETEKIDPDYWSIHSKIPQFMIFIVQKL